MKYVAQCEIASRYRKLGKQFVIILQVATRRESFMS